MFFSFFKKNSGFTLIEMLISVAILSIITGIGVINLTNYKNRHSFELDAKNVLEAIRNAENKSILGDQGNEWGIKFTSNVNNGYFEIFSGASYATSSVTVTQYLSSASRFSNPPPGFSKTIIFGQVTGIPDASQMITLKTVTGSDSSIISLGSKGALNQLPGKDLVGYWPFDEGLGTIAYDASGKGYNGTLQNSPTWQVSSACRSGQCLSFNGTNQYTIVGNLGTFPTQGTISFWINSSQMANYRNPLTTNYNGGNAGIRFEENSSGNFVVVVGNDGGTYGVGTYFISGMNINIWYHVVYTWDTSANINAGFLNGVQVFSQTNSLWPTSIPNFAIGTGFTTDPARQWNGLIDDVRIYNRALSASEIKTLYESY